MPREWAAEIIFSVASQPCSSCAMASAAITADWRCAGGYFAISRSIRFRASALSMVSRRTSGRVSIARHTPRRGRASARSYLVGPVIHVVLGACHVPQTAAVSADLFRIRIFTDLRRHHGADRDVAELGIRVVDDLVRRIGAAHRTADEVAGADFSCLVSIAKRAAALHDEEHLLLGAVAVERARALAGRDDIVGIPQVLCAEQRADAHGVALVLLTLREVLQLQFVDVDDSGIDNAHRSISPKTMSCVPMIATTSAIMCPRDISSSAARCGKPAARILSR